MILADPRNPTALRFEKALRERLGDDELEGVTLVLGGDGFMLHTVADRGFDRTYLGINAGRIGFLMNDVEDWDVLADALSRRAWREHAFPILDATLTHVDGSTTHVQAINDVAVERSSGQTAHLALSIDRAQVVEQLVADGLIVATALGSTAYAFSAGGPATHPTLDALVVAAICPHHPRLSPFLLPEGATAHISVLSPERRPVRAVVDGVGIDDVVRVEARLGEGRVRLAFLEGHDFTERMVAKILRP